MCTLLGTLREIILREGHELPTLFGDEIECRRRGCGGGGCGDRIHLRTRDGGGRDDDDEGRCCEFVGKEGGRHHRKRNYGEEAGHDDE